MRKPRRVAVVLSLLTLVLAGAGWLSVGPVAAETSHRAAVHQHDDCPEDCPARRGQECDCGCDDEATAGEHSERSERKRLCPNRDSSELDRMAAVMELQTGDVVADIGAGNGRYAVGLARHVGPEGRVYATEVSERRLDRIRDNVSDSGLDNVTVVEGSADSTGLPEACCDALVLRVVYHHLTDPMEMNRSFWESLEPGGRLYVFDNDPKRGRNAEGVPENRSGMGIDRDIVIDEVTETGFELRGQREWPELGYVLVFEKPRN